MTVRTKDLCDNFSHDVSLQIADPLFQWFGGRFSFCGFTTTIKVFEDNRLIREVLSERGDQRVLVIDGGGSRRCGLIDESLVERAVKNGWQGMLVYGCIRGTEAMSQLPMGVLALNVHPMPPANHDQGVRDVLLTFAGVNFKKDHYLYADVDGIVVANAKLD